MSKVYFRQKTFAQRRLHPTLLDFIRAIGLHPSLTDFIATCPLRFYASLEDVFQPSPLGKVACVARRMRLMFCGNGQSRRLSLQFVPHPRLCFNQTQPHPPQAVPLPQRGRLNGHLHFRFGTLEGDTVEQRSFSTFPVGEGGPRSGG